MSVHDVRPYPEDCRRARELLGARVDGPLAPGEEVLLRDHLHECQDCQVIATWIPNVDTLARGSAATNRPDDAYFSTVRDSVMAQVRAASLEPRPTARRTWLRWPVLAPTALVVVIAGVFALRQSGSPSPVGPSPTTVNGTGAVADRDVAATSPEATEEDRADAAKQEADPSSADADAARPEPPPVKDQSARIALREAESKAPSLPLAPAPGPAEMEKATPSVSLSMAREAPMTARQAFRWAMANQDTPAEAQTLTRLLEVLEQDAPAAVPALSDSIATFLGQRAASIEDDDLRERIEAWLSHR